MDIEKNIRQTVAERLCEWFIIEEEVEVCLRDGFVGYADLVLYPKDDRFSQFSFSIEVKNRQKMVQEGLARWFKQASDYVGSRIVSRNRFISSSFLWMADMFRPNGDDWVRLRAMIDLAYQFRTGVIFSDERGGIEFLMGPECMFRTRGWAKPPLNTDPWPGRALERLTSKRQAAGVKRRIGR